MLKFGMPSNAKLRTIALVFFLTSFLTSDIRIAKAQTVIVQIAGSEKNDVPVTIDPATLSFTIDKKLAAIASSHAAKEDDLLFDVLVDISSSEAPHAEAIRAVVGQLFDRLAVGGNQGYLTLFSLQAGMSKRPLQPAEARSALDQIKFTGGTALFDAVAQASQQIFNNPENRRFKRHVIIIISDGEDNYSHVTETAAINGAQLQNISIFSLSQTDAASQDQGNRGRGGRQILLGLTRETGGRLIEADKLSDTTVPLLAWMDAGRMFVLNAPTSSDGKLHTLAAKTSQKGTTLSAPFRVPIQ